MFEAIRKRYGSLSGFFFYTKYKVLLTTGRYNKYQDVEWSKVRRIIFVCSGNICRSSLAHHYCLSRGVKADSYGLICPKGDPADPRAISFGGRNDVALESHQTKNISEYKEQSGDLVVAMTPEQIAVLERINYLKAKLTIIGLWHDVKTAYLHDPYSTSDDYFSRCENIVIESCEKIVSSLPR